MSYFFLQHGLLEYGSRQGLMQGLFESLNLLAFDSFLVRPRVNFETHTWTRWMRGKRNNLDTCYQFNIRFWLNWLCVWLSFKGHKLVDIRPMNCRGESCYKTLHPSHFNSHSSPPNALCVFPRKHSEITSKPTFSVWILFKVSSQSLLGLGLSETVSCLPWRLRGSGYSSVTLWGATLENHRQTHAIIFALQFRAHKLKVFCTTWEFTNVFRANPTCSTFQLPWSSSNTVNVTYM